VKIGSDTEPVAIFPYRVAPEQMKRLRYAPTDLAGVAAILHERGVDLVADFRVQLNGALGANKDAAWRLNSRTAVIVEMSILSPRADQASGVDTRHPRLGW